MGVGPREAAWGAEEGPRGGPGSDRYGGQRGSGALDGFAMELRRGSEQADDLAILRRAIQ